jgi:peptidyl-prolyl cis-trans isomerase C
MLRRLATIALAALALTACDGKNKKTGPVVAKGEGITITADEVKARIEEQSPFMRARYSSLERKKDFVENLVRFEVLAKEAEKQGFRDDPEVQQTLRKIMVQKLVQKRFADAKEPAAEVPDADVQKFYDEHAAEYHRPKRVRALAIVFPAPAGSPDRAKKAAAAKKALAAVQAAEKDAKGGQGAFAKLVAQLSEDPASKAANGDLGPGPKTLEELEKATSKELADAVFALKQGETSGVIETPAGFYIVKAQQVQEESNRTLEQVKPQIVNRLSRERKAKEFEEWVKKLRDDAKVTIDEKALEAIQVAAPPPPPGGEPHAVPPPGSNPPPPPASGGK